MDFGFCLYWITIEIIYRYVLADEVRQTQDPDPGQMQLCPLLCPFDSCKKNILYGNFSDRIVVAAELHLWAPHRIWTMNETRKILRIDVSCTFHASFHESEHDKKQTHLCNETDTFWAEKKRNIYWTEPSRCKVVISCGEHYLPAAQINHIFFLLFFKFRRDRDAGPEVSICFFCLFEK